MTGEKIVNPVPPLLDLVLVGGNRRLHSALRADYLGIASAACEFCFAAAVNTLQGQFRGVCHLCFLAGLWVDEVDGFFLLSEITTVVDNAPLFTHFAQFCYEQ